MTKWVSCSKALARARSIAKESDRLLVTADARFEVTGRQESGTTRKALLESRTFSVAHFTFPLKWLGATVSPGYIGRITKIYKKDKKGKYYFQNLLGGNFILQIGNTFGIELQVSSYYNFYWKWNVYQAGAGLFFTIREKKDENTNTLY